MKQCLIVDDSSVVRKVARRILEAHGGALEILSIVGKGTQVRVALPIVTGQP